MMGWFGPYVYILSNYGQKGILRTLYHMNDTIIYLLYTLKLIYLIYP